MSLFNDDKPDFDDGSPGDFDIERTRMLAEFEERLATEPRLLNYDEDEWIMLADYAQDVDNLYLFSEAVIRGLTAYPDSADLSDRRLLLFNQICRPDELRKAFGAASSAPGATKIARLYRAYYKWQDAKDPNPEQAYREIRAIALDSDRLTDQETIETVRILADMYALSFMADEIDLWAAEIEFPETLWYELSATALEHSQYKIAATAVDHLTDAFPYNQKYWLLSARIHHACSYDSENVAEQRAELDRAIDDTDTAAAIDPDDSEVAAFREFMDNCTKNAGREHAENIMLYDTDGNPLTAAQLVESVGKDSLLSQMSPRILIYLFDEGTPVADNLIADWVTYMYDRLIEANKFIFSDMQAYNFYDFIDALYLFDRVTYVDRLLQLADDTFTDVSVYQPLIKLSLIRAIEKNNTARIKQLLPRLDDENLGHDVNNDLLRAIADKALGHKQQSRVSYNNYSLTIFYHRMKKLDADPETDFVDDPDVITDLHPVVQHFLVRRQLAIDEG